MLTTESSGARHFRIEQWTQSRCAPSDWHCGVPRRALSRAGVFQPHARFLHHAGGGMLGEKTVNCAHEDRRTAEVSATQFKRVVRRPAYGCPRQGAAMVGATLSASPTARTHSALALRDSRRPSEAAGTPSTNAAVGALHASQTRWLCSPAPVSRRRQESHAQGDLRTAGQGRSQ